MSITLSSVQLVVLDLDDTLFLERDFVAGGFRAVATDLAKQYNTPADDLSAEMTRLQQSGRRDIFQVILASLGITDTTELVRTLVDRYRTADRPLALCDDADRALTRWRQADLRLAILTDGPVDAQQTKVRLLQLDRRVDYILYTWQHKDTLAKPAPAAFHFLTDQFNVPDAACLHIADNENKDFAAPNQLKWRTVKIRRNRAIYAHHQASDPTARPDHTITTLDELEINP